MDIGTLVTRAGDRFGDRVAVEGPDATRTFAELASRVRRIAHALTALGLRPGDRVLDLQSNSTTFLETDLAIRAGGFVRAALNYRLHPSDWERIARDSGARALIVADHLAEAAAGVSDIVGLTVRTGELPALIESAVDAPFDHSTPMPSAASTTPLARPAPPRAPNAPTATGWPRSPT